MIFGYNLDVLYSATGTEIVVSLALVLWILAAIGVVVYALPARYGAKLSRDEEPGEISTEGGKYTIEMGGTTIEFTEEEYQGIKKTVELIEESKRNSHGSNNLDGDSKENE